MYKRSSHVIVWPSVAPIPVSLISCRLLSFMQSLNALLAEQSFGRTSKRAERLPSNTGCLSFALTMRQPYCVALIGSDVSKAIVPNTSDWFTPAHVVPFGVAKLRVGFVWLVELLLLLPLPPPQPIRAIQTATAEVQAANF